MNVLVIFIAIHSTGFLKCTKIKVQMIYVHVCMRLSGIYALCKVNVIFVKIQISNTVLQQNARDKHF